MTSVHDIVLHHLLTGHYQSKFSPNVLGLGLGGSYARGTQTQYSDLDLFIMIADISSTSYDDEIGLFVSLFPPPDLIRGPIAVKHFGDSVTVMYHDRSVVQMNFNRASSFEPNPMRSQMFIVYDRGETFAKALSRSKHSRIDREAIFHEYATWFLIRANFASRAICTNQFMRAHSYLNDMQTALMQLVRLQHNCFFATKNPYIPSSRFESDLPEQSVKKLHRTLMCTSPMGIVDQIAICLEIFEESCIALQDRYGRNVAFEQMIAAIREDIQQW